MKALKHAGIWGKTILVREDRQNKVLECLGAQKEVTEAGVDGRCSRDRLMQALRVVIEMMALILSDVEMLKSLSGAVMFSGSSFVSITLIAV